MSYLQEQLKKILKYIIQGLQMVIDPIFLLILSAGFIIWFYPPPLVLISWKKLLVISFVEELVFRFFLQECLNQIFKQKTLLRSITAANLLTSIGFSLLHLFSHPLLWSLLVIFPSLLFGWIWDRYKNVIPCWILHFSYNLLYFYRF